MFLSQEFDMTRQHQMEFLIKHQLRTGGLLSPFWHGVWIKGSDHDDGCSFAECHGSLWGLAGCFCGGTSFFNAVSSCPPVASYSSSLSDRNSFLKEVSWSRQKDCQAPNGLRRCMSIVILCIVDDCATDQQAAKYIHLWMTRSLGAWLLSIFLHDAFQSKQVLVGEQAIFNENLRNLMSCSWGGTGSLPSAFLKERNRMKFEDIL